MGHMRVHSGVKQFKCEVAGCGYASYSSQVMMCPCPAPRGAALCEGGF
jgi:hypothetical protein